jgi:hypothetical protein
MNGMNSGSELVYHGMTEERILELANDPQLRETAAEEIWAEMLRMRRRLQDIRAAHYLIFDWEIDEGSCELSAEEKQQRRAWLIKQSYAVSQKGE